MENHHECLDIVKLKNFAEKNKVYIDIYTVDDNQWYYVVDEEEVGGQVSEEQIRFCPYCGVEL